MKMYYVDSHGGESQIDAKNMQEAKRKVLEDYANCGIKLITTKEYKWVGTKVTKIDTTYR